MNRNNHIMTLLAFMAIILSLAGGTLHASDRQGTIKHAVRVLKGIDNDLSKEGALAVLRNAAADSVPYAMNALGIAYMAGIGVEKDTALAVRWMEQSGESGFHEAYHNLGMMYKDGRQGVGQDFTKSVSYFRKGVTAGSVMCLYDLGFMLYKGLGCVQDYTAAADLFQQGADRDHTPCLYMLGLCYRNGYGVERDTVRSSHLLGRAAALGYRAAMEELYRPLPENPPARNVSAAPATMPLISTEVNDTSMLAGDYIGVLVMYDWSGRYVLGEKPVAMNIRHTGKGIGGRMVLATDTIHFKAAVSPSGKLRFHDGVVELAERYTTSEKVRYRMDSATLDIWQNRMAGELSLYSLSLREPERPMYMELYRCGSASGNTDDGTGNGFTRIRVSPNPFATDFNANFELNASSPATMSIYDSFGAQVYRRDLGTLDAGTHSISVSPSILSGTYVLNITAGGQTLRTIIVKNEDGK